MPSTIGWLALAVAVGSLTGLTIGHWPVVARWLHRCLEDPVGHPHEGGGTGSGGRPTREIP